MNELANDFEFIPSYDIEGDCGVCLPFLFDDIETAIKFEKLIGAHRPVNTGKHVYAEWVPVLEKRGAHNDALNPYKNPLNAGLNMDFNAGSCKKTLDILSRTVYQMIDCNWSSETVEKRIEAITNAAKELYS